MADALDRVGDHLVRLGRKDDCLDIPGEGIRPKAVTLAGILAVIGTTGKFGCWLDDPANRRCIPHWFETNGYISVRNPHAKSGLWSINGERQMIYALASLPRAEQLKAAQKLAN